jgi:hypothetical protein
MPKNLHANSANRLFNLRDRNIALSQPPEEVIESLITEPNIRNNITVNPETIKIKVDSTFNPPSILVSQRESSLKGN